MSHDHETAATAVSAEFALTDFGRHRPWLERLIRARLGTMEVTEDVLQEVAIAVSQSRHRPNSAQELGRWLCRIALRQCALAFRTKARRDRLHQGWAAFADNDPKRDDPIYWLLAKERSELFRRALHGLDAESRELLCWKFVDCRSYRAIAERLQVTTHVAEYRIHQARQALRQALVQLGVELEYDHD